MEFKQLQSYVAVIKYGSFTKAAEKMFVSQPTISAHISALEEELNQTLIIRTTKNFKITEIGQAVFEYAEHILEMRNRLTEICQKDMQQKIYVGASTIPSAYILPSVLPEFGEKYPDIYFAIDQSDSQGVADGLLDGRFDIGFTGMKVDERLECIPFCKDRMVLVTPVTDKFLEMQKMEVLPFEQLLKEPLILREKGSGSGRHAATFFEQMGLNENLLRVSARINDQETTKHLVAGGLGISVISEMAARNFVQEKKILQFELPTHSLRNLYLVYRKDMLKPQIRAFADFVLRKYGKEHS